ncbi:glycoside hydrolase domain protein [Halalkaliarchaeum desulfuricum]|uniref:Glycoside hydrolase domain protein n=1 Tax=Halalkaliarchaeum desulfuricum TaxID=2055893 RepID=A0A343TIV2_9EURY|nr:glucodextranase DOMON-like domain-containing protein [Halalkaliarchaeum desulfuricum]AUX09024.1 glycoside hydrolase domain protein [Halalkaliarchaeum desulfuricum]
MTDDDTTRENYTHSTHRRTVLGGLAGLGLLSTVAGAGAATNRFPASDVDLDDPTGTGSYHPGEPLFVAVGEKLWNTAWVGPEYIGDRDNLAPGSPQPSADPDNYAADDFSWSVVDRPAGSDAELTYASSLFEDRPRYDEGRDNTAEFEADVAGTYTLELDAPDGTHELTIRALPDDEDAPAGSPRLELDAAYDPDADAFEIDTNAALAPDSRADSDDLEAFFLADDRDGLSTDAISVDGVTATVPADALGGESGRVYAVVHDGDRTSVTDSVELHPDGDVHLPNRAPEWMHDGVMYQIFTRSWAGERGATTFDSLIDGDDVARGVDYLEELGIDAVWLTPIHPAVSAERDLPGGGPHGYDITDYFGVADDLAPAGTDPLSAYREFVDACHDRDIRVVLDLVVNHGGRTLPEFQDTIASQTEEPEYWPIVEEWDRDSPYFDWFDRIDTPREYEGRQLEPAPFATGFWNLQLHPNFNFDNVALREYMLAVAEFWSGEVGVDGFRCDIAWGVPHSFWKDLREVVRANNSAFLLLDEAIPNDPAFSENEFDMHFDTDGFTVPAHAVARGEAAGADLFDRVRDRRRQGFPDYSLILNAVENHDEYRVLNEALDGSRDDPKKAQRAVWAAGVTLPGVPHIYYGMERAISVNGEGRHMGEADHRDGDVHPGGKQRAFMNWSEYDEGHLDFYQSLVAAYQELDVLKPDATLSGAWYNSASDVLVFGRDAGDIDDVDGPERVVVVVNFEAGPAQVFLRPSVGGVDHVSGEDISVETLSDARAVEVETIAVLETPDLLEIGSPISEPDVESGTDYGADEYVYPTGEEYVDGAFDLAAFGVHETPDAYQFRAEIDGDLTNPWELPGGFSLQHLQVYVRDPERDDGTTVAREGVNAELAAPYQYRVVADGEHGSRVESPDGELLAAGEVKTNEVTGAIVAEVPKWAFDADVEDLSVAPLLLGYDSDAPGDVRPVEAEAGPDVFGGGRDDDANPNVIDLVVDVDIDRETALSYDSDSPAEIGYVPLVTPFEEVATFDVETGTGNGPGTYEIPTGDDYYEGAWDIDRLEVHESRDRVRFDYRFTEPLENPWEFDVGFSHQLPQVYVFDPETDDPATTQGRTATNVAFEAPYNYRVNVNPEAGAGVEDAAGEGVTRDVSVDADQHTIRFDVPKAAIGWDRETGVAIAAVVCPFDGFGEGGLRAIAAEADTHVIGGGEDGVPNPKVMDLITPEEVDRSGAFGEYDADSPPVLPYVTLGDLTREELLEAAGEPDDEDAAGETEGETDEEGDETDDETETDPETPTEPAETDTETPGFGIGAGAAAVGAAGWAAKSLAERRAGDEDDRE